MTYDEFLDRLRQTPRAWITLGGDQIRLQTFVAWNCPITALAPSFRVDSWRDAAKSLGLKAELAEEIATAADGWKGRPRKLLAIRSDLLKACGLTEKRK